jgi:hypothetical protein
MTILFLSLQLFIKFVRFWRVITGGDDICATKRTVILQRLKVSLALAKNAIQRRNQN